MPHRGDGGGDEREARGEVRHGQAEEEEVGGGGKEAGGAEEEGGNEAVGEQYHAGEDGGNGQPRKKIKCPLKTLLF